MFAISSNGEHYDGHHETIEDAVDDAIENECERFWVGEMKTPRQPEAFIDATKFLEDLSESTCGDDDWNTEYSEWDIGSSEQVAELEAALKATVAEWLDKHNLRPKWFVIHEAVEYEVEDGVATIVK